MYMHIYVCNNLFYRFLLMFTILIKVFMFCSV